ncbi:MAG: hypothetical protein RBT22_08990 [Aliarcobacter sp.]|jgi:hypothetical protein|nr:hypothetical protein [Aliarcobacter sp.]
MDDEKKEKRKKIFSKIFRKIEKAQKNEKIIQEIMKYKYIAITVLIIIFLFFFQIWNSKVPEFQGKLKLEPLISENKAIEQDIKNQILAQKAEEIGVKPINNPDIQDYLNLFLQKGTIIWDFTTNEQTTYNGVDVVVKAVKLQNGSTVFTINNIQYYIKE